MQWPAGIRCGSSSMGVWLEGNVLELLLRFTLSDSLILCEIQSDNLMLKYVFRFSSPEWVGVQKIGRSLEHCFKDMFLCKRASVGRPRAFGYHLS